MSLSQNVGAKHCMLFVIRFRYSDHPCTSNANPPAHNNRKLQLLRANRSLQLLLWAKLVGVATLLLAAVGGARGKTGLLLQSAGVLFATDR